jgi:two-component system chemotaxis response regulator CheY
VRVLVADDEPTTRTLARAIVQRLGHECLVAPDGDRAWTLLQSSAIDLLITDWMMPGIDGPELCRRIRARDDDTYTYIILATVVSDRDHVLEGMRAGADDYLIKPIDPFAVQTRLIAAERVTALHRQIAEFRLQLERLNRDLAEQARTDALTQLGNRLRLHEDLDVVHARAARHQRPYSVALFDLDHFKSYNDSYGHPEGDRALQQVAAVLAADIRTADAAYRYGGEEFLVLLADERLPEAFVIAERLRQTIESVALTHRAGESGVLTISAGVASFDPGQASRSAAEIVERADQALYLAKQDGRNRVVAATTDGATNESVESSRGADS